MYLKHLITTADVTRARSDATVTATDTVDSSVTADWKEGKNWIPVPDSVLAVVQVFPFDESSTSNMFDVRYQLRLKDLYDFSSTSVIHYDLTMKHLDFLQHILVGETALRFNQHQNRLYLDMDWENDISAGEYLIFEVYRKASCDHYHLFLKQLPNELLH